MRSITWKLSRSRHRHGRAPATAAVAVTGVLLAGLLAGCAPPPDDQPQVSVATTALPYIPFGGYDWQNPGLLLVVQGGADPYNAYASARRVYLNAARWPKAMVRVIGGGHSYPYLGDGFQSDTVRAATVDWLDWTVKGQDAAGRFLARSTRPGTTALERAGF